MSLDFQQWKKSPLTRVSSGEPQTLSTLESIPSPPLHPETGGGYCLQNLYYFICPQGSLITQISSPQIFHFKCLIQNNYHHQHHHAPQPRLRHPGGGRDHHSILFSHLDWAVQWERQTGSACHAPQLSKWDQLLSDP